MKELFDKYNLRARLSPMIILISPVLLNMYILVESIREFSTTLVVAISAGALINILTLFSRYKGGDKIKGILDTKNVLAQEILSPLNECKELNLTIKQRYYDFINKNVPYANISYNLKDKKEISEQCHSAVKWLRERSRMDNRFSLVQEESINTGFCKNMYGIRVYGIVLNLILIVSIIMYNYFLYEINIRSIPITSILCIGIDFIYLLIWCFIINKNLINCVYKKYSLALLATCDVDK